MYKFSSEILFAFAMLAMGAVALFFTNEICVGVIKLIGERKGLFNLVNSAGAKLSIRFGGVIAVVLGLFVLWMCWRNA
jgi:hypothetical protein